MISEIPELYLVQFYMESKSQMLHNVNITNIFAHPINNACGKSHSAGPVSSLVLVFNTASSQQ